MKYVIYIIFLFLPFIGISQNIQTKPFLLKGGTRVNNQGTSIGKTSYQVDKSIYTYQIPYNNYYVNAYYYYIWFYNESSYYDGYQWKKASTYIQSIDVYSDNVFIGNYYLLITGDYQYLTIWSINPNAKITIVISNPIPYF